MKIGNINEGLSPYSIGTTPIFDPCLKCLVKACCSEICTPRMRWWYENKKPTPVKIRLNKRKKKNEKCHCS